MHLEQLRKKLIIAARETAPADHVPFAFERRIMARLGTPAPDVWTLWGRMLWRAAAPCLAITCALTIWSLLVADAAPAGTSLAADLENTVLEPLSTLRQTW
jgi:hypothetical protein